MIVPPNSRFSCQYTLAARFQSMAAIAVTVARQR